MMQTPKQMCATQLRSLKAMKAKVVGYECDWEDVDMHLASKLRDLALSLDEAIEGFETEATG